MLNILFFHAIVTTNLFLRYFILFHFDFKFVLNIYKIYLLYIIFLLVVVQYYSSFSRHYFLLNNIYLALRN